MSKETAYEDDMLEEWIVKINTDRIIYSYNCSRSFSNSDSGGGNGWSCCYSDIQSLWLDYSVGRIIEK